MLNDKTPYFQIVQTEKGFIWILYNAKHDELARSGTPYTRKNDCTRALKNIKDNITKSKILEVVSEDIR